MKKTTLTITQSPDALRAVKPVKMRKRAKLYRLIKRKKSRYIAVRIGKKQRSSKECDLEMARAFALRWIAEAFPRIAQELGVEVTPVLPALRGERRAESGGSSGLVD